MFELVDVLKSMEKSFVALVYDEKFALNILRQLCACLAVIHKAAIIHRDLKPSNILLTKENVVKLIDFGIARKFKPESFADTEYLGTRGYASPKQFGLFDFGKTNARSDIYSLGITIKQLLDAIDNRLRFQKFKRVLIVGIVGLTVFALPFTISEDIQPVEIDKPELVLLAEEIPVKVEKVPDKTPPAVNPKPLPAPVAPKKISSNLVNLLTVWICIFI